MHICVGKLIFIGSDNGLSPDRCQAIIWPNAGLLLIGPLGTNFSENLIRIQSFSFKKMHLKMSSAKWRPFCYGINVLNKWKPPRSCLATPDAISKCQQLSYCGIIDTQAASYYDVSLTIILMLFLWTLSLSQWHCQPGTFKHGGLSSWSSLGLLLCIASFLW